MPPDPDILVPLTTARTEFEAATIAAALRHEGIGVEVFATAGNALGWEAAMTNPIRVMVRRREAAAASSVLRAIRSQSVDIDWDELDVGEPESMDDANRGPLARRIGGFSEPMAFVRRVGGMLLVFGMMAWAVPSAGLPFVAGGALVVMGLRRFARDSQPTRLNEQSTYR